MLTDTKPTDAQLRVLKALADIEAGTTRFVNSQDAERCCDLGWAEAVPGGGYRLTAEGRLYV